MHAHVAAGGEDEQRIAGRKVVVARAGDERDFAAADR
jgi:hypothetical protein